MEHKKQILLEEFISIDGVDAKEKDEELKSFFNLLKCCKEISNSEFALPGTDLRKLTLVEIKIHCTSGKADKVKRYQFSGSFNLSEDEKSENRCIYGVMTQTKDTAKFELEITRLGNIPLEEKEIHTTDKIVVNEESIAVQNETRIINANQTKKSAYILPFSREINHYNEEAVRLIKHHRLG